MKKKLVFPFLLIVIALAIFFASKGRNEETISIGTKEYKSPLPITIDTSEDESAAIIEQEEPLTVTSITEEDIPEVEAEEDTYDDIGTVVRVVDGDTFVATVNGENIKIRLIGVDTPESVSPDESKNCEEGKEASDFTKSLLSADDTVYLEYDAGKEDKYGRTLAYVYLENGEMLQDILLVNGYAKIMTVQPNVKYQDRFLEEEKEAEENNIGFWKNYYK